jgi:IS30 family transposase
VAIEDQLPVGGILKPPKVRVFTMSYKQLIEGQRYQIQVYLHEGLSYREVAKKLGVSHSTISREIRRNHNNNCVYDPKHAQLKSLQRRYTAKKRRVNSTTIAFVEFGPSLKWSPEQISGVASILQL